MRLTGAESAQWQDALLDAFPRQGDLAQMVRNGLDEHLASIAQGSNLSDTVAELLAWAAAHDRIEDVRVAALQANANNRKLQALPHYPVGIVPRFEASHPSILARWQAPLTFLYSRGRRWWHSPSPDFWLAFACGLAGGIFFRLFDFRLSSGLNVNCTAWLAVLAACISTIRYLGKRYAGGLASIARWRLVSAGIAIILLTLGGGWLLAELLLMVAAAHPLGAQYYHLWP